MENFDLGYIKDALKSNAKRVPVLFRIYDKKTGELIMVKKELPTKTVLRQLSKPYEQRLPGWKNVVPVNYKGGAATTAESAPKIDRNLLSSPELIELLANNPDALKSLTKAVKETVKANEPEPVKSETQTTETTEDNA